MHVEVRAAVADLGHAAHRVGVDAQHLQQRLLRDSPRRARPCRSAGIDVLAVHHLAVVADAGRRPERCTRSRSMPGELAASSSEIQLARAGSAPISSRKRQKIESGSRAALAIVSSVDAEVQQVVDQARAPDIALRNTSGCSAPMSPQRLPSAAAAPAARRSLATVRPGVR